MVEFKVFVEIISGMLLFGGMWAVLAVPSWLLWWRKGEDMPAPLAFGAYALGFVLWLVTVIAANPMMLAP